MSEELSGDELDAAVAKAAGYPLDEDGDRLDVRSNGGAPTEFHPSTDWAHGGPIIERERITIDAQGAVIRGEKHTWWRAWLNPGVVRAERFHENGPTPLIAAMRAFVSSKR